MKKFRVYFVNKNVNLSFSENFTAKNKETLITWLENKIKEKYEGHVIRDVKEMKGE